MGPTHNNEIGPGGPKIRGGGGGSAKITTAVWLFLMTVNSGGFRIQANRLGGEGGREREHTILPKFPKNFIKLKEFGPQARPRHAPLTSAND